MVNRKEKTERGIVKNLKNILYNIITIYDNNSLKVFVFLSH